MRLNMIGHTQTKFRVLRKPLPEILRVALAERAALGRIARNDRPRSVGYEVGWICEQRVLGIVRKETKTCRAIAVAQGKEIVRHRIAGRDEGGHGRIKVARV